MFAIQPQSILNIDIFILPTDWNIFSNAMASINAGENVNTMLQYCTPRSTTFLLLVNIDRKAGIISIHIIISTIPCKAERASP